MTQPGESCYCVALHVPIITFETVTKAFTPESFGIKEVSFAVEPGEMIFITGHSGSGKTTLMKLLTREYTPTSGEVFFQEEPLSDLSKHSLHTHRRRIGVVFQDYQLVPEMNVWENIALPLYVANKKQDEVEQRVTDLLNLIKLPEKADQFPSQLSGGEAQRVSIARALAIGPEVIFADEPTGNLDPDTSLTIARLLKKINELGTTILVATHDQEVFGNKKDTRYIVLEKGVLVSDSGVTSKKTPHKAADSEEATTKAKQPEPTATTTTADEKEASNHDQATKASSHKEKKAGWGWFGKKANKADATAPTKEKELQADPEPKHKVEVAVESLSEPEEKNEDSKKKVAKEKKVVTKKEKNS